MQGKKKYIYINIHSKRRKKWKPVVSSLRYINRDVRARKDEWGMRVGAHARQSRLRGDLGIKGITSKLLTHEYVEEEDSTREREIDKSRGGEESPIIFRTKETGRAISKRSSMFNPGERKRGEGFLSQPILRFVVPVNNELT